MVVLRKVPPTVFEESRSTLTTPSGDQRGWHSFPHITLFSDKSSPTSLKVISCLSLSLTLTLSLHRIETTSTHRPIQSPNCTLHDQVARRVSRYSVTLPDDDIEMKGSPSKDNERDGECVSAPSPNICFAPYGCLHLEIIDEGVGMAAEDCKQLFKSIVQFNPNELQV